jgi:hypothetical protein
LPCWGYDYSALKREASEKWFKKYMVRFFRTNIIAPFKHRFFIKPKNPLGSEWVLKNKNDVSIIPARPADASAGAQRADAAFCSSPMAFRTPCDGGIPSICPSARISS